MLLLVLGRRCQPVAVPWLWLGVLGERDFRLLFTGYLTSFVGSQMVPVAVTFAVLDSGGSAAEVGWVLAAETVPLVVFLLAGGVLADRLPRRAVMIGADVMRVASQGMLAALLLTGRPALWVFMVLLAVTGIGLAFSGPAMTGLIPQVASSARLQQANTMNGLAQSVGTVVGPAVSGVLVAAVGAGWAVAADAASYLVSAYCLVRIGVPLVAAAARSSFVSDLRLGWREFRSRTWLWVVVVDAALWHLLVYAPFMVLGAVVAKADLGGAGAWGVILAASGAGAVAGGLVLLRVRPRRPLLAAVASSFTFAAPLAALAVRAPVAVIAACAFVDGIGLATFGALWDTTMQREIPPGVLSRVSAYDWFGSVAFLPLGYAVAGPLAGLLTVTGTLWLATGWLVITTGAVLAVPGVTGLRAPPREVPEPVGGQAR
jgi:MFS family permease